MVRSYTQLSLLGATDTYGTGLIHARFHSNTQASYNDEGDNVRHPCKMHACENPFERTEQEP